jgi:4'-phosphopantetheinyl transferase
VRTEVAIVSVSAAEVDALRPLLSADERRKVERYRFEADRRRSIVGRGTLRQLLGRRLGRDPRELAFVEGPQGKPALERGELEFNVSHSGDRVAIAIAEGTAVGIDIEVEQPRMTDLAQLARRYFAPDEAAEVEKEEDAALFFTIWTAKEAVIKAVGGGLSIELASFSVLPVSTVWGDVKNMAGWRVAALQTDEGYRAAIAARGGEIVRL